MGNLGYFITRKCVIYMGHAVLYQYAKKSQRNQRITPFLMATFIHSLIYSFIPIVMCRMRQFLAVLRSFFHSSLLCIFTCHPSPPTILPSSLTPSCHIFLGLPLHLVVPKFIYNTLLGILFSSILCTCPNQRNLFNIVCFLLGNSPASDLYMPTFLNTLSVPCS